MIFVTSDTHFFHDREFVWKKRGFENVDEMNEVLVENWNRVVSENDTVYHLGDVFLGVGNDYEKAGKLLSRLHGKIHLITGNHDQEAKLAYLQENVTGVVSIERMEWIVWRKHTVVLSHYPVVTGGRTGNRLHSAVYCLYGHTHQTDPYRTDIPLGLNVGVDCQHLSPVPLDDAMMELRQRCLEIGVFRSADASGQVDGENKALTDPAADE